MYKIFVFLLILAPFGCLAQFTISGKVIDHGNMKPAANINVFLNNATIGGETAKDGTFILQNVKPGKYEVVVSSIGFDAFSKVITVGKSNVNLDDIFIYPKTNVLKEVTIKVDHNREKYFILYYQRFKDQFLGTSAFARDCTILNPNMLDFSYDDGTGVLTVSTTDFLQIENRALGYKVNYLLNNFTFNTITRDLHYEGPALFTEMKGTRAQELNWQQNRKEAYEGSDLHFLRALLNDRLEMEGFRAYQLARYNNPDWWPDTIIKKKIKEFSAPAERINWPDSLPFWKNKVKQPKMLQTLLAFPLNKEDLVTNTSVPGLYQFGCDSAKLVIEYAKDHHFTAVKQLQDLTNLNYIVNKSGNKELTLMEIKQPYFFFDDNGRVTDPNSTKLSGVWGNKRVAELLPINFEAAQTPVFYADSMMRTIKSKIDSFSTEHITEKVHLHLDRPWYGLGDTIWFKAYTVSGASHQLSALSEVLHMELINDKDSVVKRLTLQLEQGICNGDFKLDSGYTPGIYRIRAYTNWMLNDSASFYDQKVVVGDVPTAANAAAAGKNPVEVNPGQKPIPGIDMQFFPEGGELVAGLRSKVAFKAVNPNGVAALITGVVYDQDGNEVASFSSQHLGMGAFPLTPQPGKKYKATITANGDNFNFDLPQVKPYGFTLSVNNTGDSVYVKVAANTLFYNNNQNSPFYLVGQSGGKVYYSAGSTLSAPVFVAQIEKSRFPSGIVQFTLFSKSGEPLNERIIYVENKDRLKLELSALKQTYAPKEKVTIDLNATDKLANTVAGSFSVSVTDETKVPVDEQSEPDIFTGLLLTSELKGYVENPNYYFINENEKTHTDLDLLMLTQGYRKFEWKKILAGNGSKITYRPQTSSSLSGTIKTTHGVALPNRKVRLTSIKDHFVADTVTDINGDFTFTGLYLADTTKVIISSQVKKGNNDIKIYLKEPGYPPVNKIGPVGDYADSSFSPIVRAAMQQTYASWQHGKVIQLKEVKIEQRKKNPVFEATYSDNIKYSSNLNGPGNANQVLLGDKLIGCSKLSECLQGKLYGVTFSAGGLPISIRAMSRHLNGTKPMAVIIEGIQRGPEDLDNINVEDVYSIEVLTSISYLTIYGSNAPNGALIITMKRGSDYNPATIPVDGLITYKINGFYKSREFYSPKYDPANPVNTVDNRKTIYWNPNIITDTKGKTSFEYFNADGKGAYRVVIEGIDADGNLGRAVYRYKVQ